MSKKNHPNIQPIAFTMDIIKSIRTHLRGKGPDIKNEITGDKIISNLLIDFVADVSTRIDEIVEREK